MTYLLGVDASRYQEDIDPQPLIAAGVRFVILKATEMLRQAGPIDPYFLRNRDACQKAGLLVAAYGFIDPTDGISQADLLIKTAGLNVRLALDNEAAGVTKQEVDDFIIECHSSSGLWPIFYTGNYVLDRQGSHTDDVIQNCPLWIAQPGATAPTVPAPFTTWTLWQYGYLNLESKTFDANYFNGTEDELRRLFTVSDTLTVQARVISPSLVTAYKEPHLKGEIAGYYNVGDTVQVFPQSIEDTDNAGVFFIATPEQWYVLLTDLQMADNTNPTPPPPPPPVPTVVSKVVNAPAGLNLRSAPVIGNNVKVTMPNGATIQVTLPALTTANHFILTSYKSNAGNIYSGWASLDLMRDP